MDREQIERMKAGRAAKCAARRAERDAALAAGEPVEERAPSPLRAIRAKCLECSCGSYAEVTLCVIVDCPLWAFRSGHRPAHANTRGGWCAGRSPCRCAE